MGALLFLRGADALRSANRRKRKRSSSRPHQPDSLPGFSFRSTDK